MKKVFVTGVGVISSAGVGVDSLAHALCSSVSTATELDSGKFGFLPARYACQVESFNVLDYVKFGLARHMTRCSQFGVSAAAMAVKDANLDLSSVEHDRVQVYEGTSVAGLDAIFSDYEVFLRQGFGSMNPTTAGQAFIGSTTGEISIVLGLRSRCMTICAGSASSSDAIGLGFEQIALGLADVAIVGGSEAPIVPGILGSFCRAGVVSTRQDGASQSPRAFTIDRDGFVVGEGAAFLVLESESHALARGARKYAELAGFSNGCDAYQMLSPHPEGVGVKRVASRAMSQAQIVASDVQYINAHGTGTKLNDKFESLAFSKIFEKSLKNIFVSSTKPTIGHLLGASGAIEAVVCILTIGNSVIPPLINYGGKDPECDLNFVVNKAKQANVNCAMSFNYGFGGKNSVLIFKKA